MITRTCATCRWFHPHDIFYPELNVAGKCGKNLYPNAPPKYPHDSCVKWEKARGEK